MAKRKRSGADDSDDPNVAAFRVLQHVTRETEPKASNIVPLKPPKNQAAVALGRKGGQKSAAARLEKIAPAERRRIASHAARQRWARKTKGDG